MVSSFSWIKTALDGHFKGVNWQRGLDLDGDGLVSSTEQIHDYNNDGQVADPKDWEHFLISNADALQRRVDFFKWAAPLNAPLKTDNPIHECLSIESELATPQEVKEVYAFVEAVLKRVRSLLNDGRQRSNQEKLKLIYDVMKELGVRFIAQENSLLTANVRDKTLDCDTSSFVVKAIAHEMGWPVYLVQVPGHVFVRWEEMGGEKFNMDYGKVYKDELYVQRKGLSQASIDLGVYLSSRSSQELKAIFFTNRGISKANRGRYEEAIRDYDEAIRLDPKSVLACYDRGHCKEKLGRNEEAVRDYETALRMDPNFAIAKNDLALLKGKLGRGIQ